MAIPTCTKADLAQLISESGYPFELTVAQRLLAKGYNVRLSHQFFHPLRQHEAELDILATLDREYVASRAGRVRCTLELAIECKDNSLPYVLFGFPAPPPPGPGMLDPDFQYSKIRSTEDKFPNYFAIPSLADGTGSNRPATKPSHHQFSTTHRYHRAAAVELQNSKLKLHTSERLRISLTGLGGYVESMQETWLKGIKALETGGLSYGPSICITFFLLIHSGQHFRYTAPGSLAEADHTTLFTSFHSASTSVPYAVDFVAASELPAALGRIEATFEMLAKHLVGWLEPSSRPSHRGT